MADSISEGFGKLLLGGVVGFGLYYLVTGLGFGGLGSGEGRGPGPGRGEPSTPEPTLPKDEARLSFLMIQPTADDPTRPMSFRSADGTRYTIEEMLARVKAGGRYDVTLKIRGDVRAGAGEAAQILIKQAGIEIWKDTPRVSGNNVRGEYGIQRRGYR